METMKVSVIIPTYNGAHKVLNALKSLEQQVLMPDEVIVVIDGSTDGTIDLLRKTKLDLPGFKIIEQPNGGRAKVRNRGAEEATGVLLVFMDDDIIAPTHWLSSHVEHHNSIENCLLCGRLESASMKLSGEFKVFEEWQNRKWNMDITQSFDEVIILKSPYLSANNFSIKKDLFRTLEKFDERLNDAEDYDLAVRAFQKEYQIYFSSKAYVYHHDVSLKNFKSYIKRLRQYREAQEKLLYYKPEIYSDPIINKRKPVHPKGVKSKVFKFFAQKYWISAIEKNYLKWLPRSMRCKFYDVIVTANGTFFPNKVLL